MELERFYITLEKIHENSFPDMKFGKFFYSFTTWVALKKKLDICKLTNEEFIYLAKEYANKNSKYYRGW